MKLSALSALTAVSLLAFGGQAKAADLGGDCCADLEERVAELESTTVRKGNRKVSVTITGWVWQEVMFWDDGNESNVYVVGESPDSGTNFQITGSAKISNDLSAGYKIHLFFDPTNAFSVNQDNDNVGSGVGVQSSKWWVKSDRYGQLAVGKQHPAADNAAILTDFTGTLLVSNSVTFEGASFFLTPNGGTRTTGDGAGIWQHLLWCNSQGFGIANDCNGVRINTVRYDSPTIAGFNFAASWGEDDRTEFSARYTKEARDFKFSAAVGYGITEGDGLVTVNGVPIDTDYFQAGLTVKHLPTGLWFHGVYGQEHTDNPDVPDGEGWFMKAGLTRKNTLGSLHIWGEYGENQGTFGFFEIGSGRACAAFDGTGANLDAACASAADTTVDITDSQVWRFGAGIQQDISAASLSLFAQWRMLDGEVEFSDAGVKGKEDFEDLQMLMVGGIIFF